MPARFAPYLYGLLLSGFMSCVVSGIATVRSVGFPPDLHWLWLTSWLSSWAVAFPAVLVVAPTVRLIVSKVVRDEPSKANTSSPSSLGETRQPDLPPTSDVSDVGTQDHRSAPSR